MSGPIKTGSCIPEKAEGQFKIVSRRLHKTKVGILSQDRGGCRVTEGIPGANNLRVSEYWTILPNERLNFVLALWIFTVNRTTYAELRNYIRGGQSNVRGSGIEFDIFILPRKCIGKCGIGNVMRSETAPNRFKRSGDGF